MPKQRRWFLLALLLAACLLAGAVPGQAGVPDVLNSYYVPQVGTVASPSEGATAILQFRACPNNDVATTNLSNHARIKIVVQDVNNNPISGIAAADICVLFNGGTATQGFSGVGADSIIANTTYNPICPNIRCMAADAPTDAGGVAYITFAGANSANPGVAVRDANRKWGHYDTELPVYVLGFKISGRLTSGSANGTYALRIKNYDVVRGLGTIVGTDGERVNTFDYSHLVANLGVPGTDPDLYWLDTNNTNSLNIFDFSNLVAHMNHGCQFPTTP